MATSRKHYFRVADSILREPWDRDTKLTMILLAAHLNQRWARDGLTADQACRATLSRADLHQITGRSHRAFALNALRLLGECVSISIRVLGEYTEIHWPKFAEFQGLRSEVGAVSGQKTPLPHSASASAPASSEKEKRYEPPAGPARPATATGSARASRPRIARTPAPDALDSATLLRLESWAGRSHPHVADRTAELATACLTHHRARGNVMADWYAAAQTWIRNEAEGRFGARRNGTAARPQTFAEISTENTKAAAREALAIWERRQEEEANERRRVESGRGGTDYPANPALPGPRH